MYLWYEVNFCNPSTLQWEKLLDGNGETRKLSNPYEAKRQVAAAKESGLWIDALAVRVEQAPYSCVVTRQLMTATIYTGLRDV
jgi:hypothetical protein